MTVHPLDESNLIDLAHGLLPESERERLLDHIRSCEQCENAFRDVVRERERARAVDWPISRVPRASRARLAGWTAVVAAATVALLVVLPRLNHQPTPAQYWIPVEQEATVLRSTNEQSGRTAVGGALDAYLRHDAATAVVELQAFHAPSESETSRTLRDLFLASALVNDGRYHEADDVLSRITIESMPTQWRRQARWVRYMTWSQMGLTSEAHGLLEQLQHEDGEIGRLARGELERGR